MLLLRKGVYPYAYMDNWDRFDEKELPNKSDFYGSFNMDEITCIDYRHAKKVFDKFCIKNLGEYHDLYVQSETLLLADVFENFRDMCIKVYGQGLAWQACLKKTGVKLELLKDMDMLLMIKEGIRGVILYIDMQKTNNKYMEDYDKNKEPSCIIYVDYKDLYGEAMSQKLPVDGFEWVEDLSAIDEDFIKNYDEDSDVGYIIKDLESLHRDLPFLPERMRSLKQALNHGLVLQKVHRVITFNQRACFKEYIDMNRELRRNANNDFEKDFFKLMNNAVSGKIMENVRKHRDIKLVNTDIKRNKLVSEPNYHTTKWFSENLLAIEMKKKQ